VTFTIKIPWSQFRIILSRADKTSCGTFFYELGNRPMAHRYSMVNSKTGSFHDTFAQQQPDMRIRKQSTQQPGTLTARRASLAPQLRDAASRTALFESSSAFAVNPLGALPSKDAARRENHRTITKHVSDQKAIVGSLRLLERDSNQGSNLIFARF
jgi:hypothetical protein